jgi:hypothetical protein
MSEVVDFKDKKSMNVTCLLSKSKKTKVVIKDKIEGDINLEFDVKMDDTKRCYTKYEVTDSFNAKIKIFNVLPSQYSRTIEPILLGTYGNSSLIKLTYMLEPMDANKERKLELHFYLEAK